MLVVLTLLVNHSSKWNTEHQIFRKDALCDHTSITYITSIFCYGENFSKIIILPHRNAYLFIIIHPVRKLNF